MAGEPYRDNVAASVAELQSPLLSTGDMAAFLQDLAVLAASRVAGGLSCGITMQPGGRPMTVASSDTLADQMDDVQYGLDEGPCLHAMRTGQLVRIDDTVGEDRWAGFSSRAATRGIRSTLSLPLTADGQHIAALNLCADAPGSFGAASTTLTSRLRAALAARAVMDGALGVIMAQERCNQPRAFAILRSASQSRNVKLADIAAQVVTGGTDEPPQP